jgi:antitoxin component YwqK of YwqJK toxin-antitoxin module
MNEKTQVPQIWWVDKQGKKHRYYCDFFVPKENLMLEVKSTWTFKQDDKKEKICKTKQACEAAGYLFECWIFDQKGNKVSEGVVKNKLFEGQWKYYHQESKDIMTLENYKNGKLNGVRKVFYKANKLAEEINYTEGKKNGIGKTFAENGKQIDQHQYVNDMFEGVAIYFDGNGKKLYEGTYKNNLKVGIWKFYENDKIVKQVKADKFSKELKKVEQKLAKKFAKSTPVEKPVEE